jgi:hypothetical protein
MCLSILRVDRMLDSFFQRSPGEIGHDEPYSSRYHSWLAEMALKELAPLFEQMHGEVGLAPRPQVHMHA